VKKASRNTILVIKDLIEQKHQDKHIAMVMQVNRSFVNKIRNKVSHASIVIEADERINLTEEQKVRLETLKKILAAPELMISGTSEQDLIYIHVLRFFGMNKDEVYNLYFHLSKKQLGNYWMKADVNILKFNPRLIGIEPREYADLIIDFFI
jgi:hypothetical protein